MVVRVCARVCACVRACVFVFVCLCVSLCYGCWVPIGTGYRFLPSRPLDYQSAYVALLLVGLLYRLGPPTCPGVRLEQFIIEWVYLVYVPAPLVPIANTGTEAALCAETLSERSVSVTVATVFSGIVYFPPPQKIDRKLAIMPSKVRAFHKLLRSKAGKWLFQTSRAFGDEIPIHFSHSGSRVPIEAAAPFLVSDKGVVGEGTVIVPSPHVTVAALGSHCKPIL